MKKLLYMYGIAMFVVISIIGIGMIIIHKNEYGDVACGYLLVGWFALTIPIGVIILDKLMDKK